MSEYVTTEGEVYNNPNIPIGGDIYPNIHFINDSYFAPYIDETTGTWFQWDNLTSAFINTDIVADYSDVEAIRVANENTRISNENLRITQENQRVIDENIRLASELIRVSNENTRLLNESARKDAEDVRVIAENTRISNENIRIQSELDRISTENARVIAEQGRVSAEQIRISNENARILAEQSRVNDFNAIKSDYYDVVKSDAISATNTANNAASNANLATTNANLATTNANNAAQRAENATIEAENIADSKIDKTAIKQELGDSETDIMSQKAVTDEISTIEADIITNTNDIRTLENTLNSVNINQETIATVTGVDIVSLPKTAANTGMSVQLFGQSAENLVVNGDFRNGTTGFNTEFSVNSILNGNLINTGNGNNREPNLYKSIKLVDTNKYYIRTRARVTNSECIFLRQRFYGVLSPDYQINTPVQNKWYDFNRVVQATNEGNNPLYIMHNYTDSATANGKIAEVENFTLINLTATFGAGNEPTKEQCDAMFSDYFEGVKSVVPTGRIRSVGKNLLDSSKDRKKIYTGQADGLTTKQRYVFYDILIGGTRDSIINASNVNNYSIEGDKVIVSNKTGGYGVTFKFKAIAGKRYYRSAVLSSGFDGVGIAIFDKFGNLLVHSRDSYINAPVNSSFGVLCLTSNTFNTDITYTNVGVFETSLPTIYEPYKETNLYLTAPELQSNGTVKDEIRKGANGYELVKRVGVGTLGSELIANGVFATDTTWLKQTGWTISGGSANYDATTNLVNIRQSITLEENSFYEVKFTVLSGTARIEITSNAGGLIGCRPAANYATGSHIVRFKATATNGIAIFAYNTDTGTAFTLDNFSVKKIIASDGVISDKSVFTVLGSNIHYTLATPVITPISYGGVLNSAERGTVYHEPVIADAGVYSTNLAVQLTDYPITSFKSIRKYANGTYTELNTATAIIASDGLSFTHPDLVSGDLVMFTYAYNKESIGRSITLTHYDSRFVQADTANGKVYKIVPVVTNGVVSWTAVEV